MSSRVLVRMAMYLAMFAVLDYVAATSGLFRMPQGGSLGLGAIALILATLDLGFAKGLLLALVSIPLQQITSGPLWYLHWFQFALDYVLAYGAYALVVLFPIYKIDGFHVITGVIVANTLRFGFHVLSGMWYYEVPLMGSLIYNAWYMVPTLILTFVLLGGIVPRLNLQTSNK